MDSNNKNKLSVVIITYNEELNIQKCLTSICTIADEIIVVDSFSTDKTENICAEFQNLKFIKHPFENYSQQKQYAINLAANNWVLSIDADEFISESLQSEIKDIKHQGFSGGGYYIRRSTIYQGKKLNYCGMHLEKHLRLFNTQMGKFTTSKVHEKFVSTEPCTTLNGKMAHCPYRNIRQHLDKINQYTTLWAEDNAGKKHCSKLNIYFKSIIRFLTIYFIKLAVLDGYAGFVWAKMGAFYSFLKYAKLYELNANERGTVHHLF